MSARPRAPLSIAARGKCPEPLRSLTPGLCSGRWRMRKNRAQYYWRPPECTYKCCSPPAHPGMQPAHPPSASLSEREKSRKLERREDRRDVASTRGPVYYVCATRGHAVSEARRGGTGRARRRRRPPQHPRGKSILFCFYSLLKHSRYANRAKVSTRLQT